MECYICKKETLVKEYVISCEGKIRGFTDICEPCMLQIKSMNQVELTEYPQKSDKEQCCLNCNNFQLKIWFNKTKDGESSRGYCKLFPPYLCLSGKEVCDKHEDGLVQHGN